ncbi:hypothetical protein WL99_22210 [Burkholderia cepacia]|nr:hypothetical protein WL99_22210 [Burkholderia cepacia]
MPPHDLDLVELGTVGGQIEQDSFVINQPAVPRCLVDAVMDARVIEHDHGRTAIGRRAQIVNETHDVGAFDSAGMDQRVRAVVQGTKNTASAVRIRFDLVRQTPW